MIISDKKEPISSKLTKGHVSDNDDHLLLMLSQNIFRILYGDKSHLVEQSVFGELLHDGAYLITKIKKNMDHKLMSIHDKTCSAKEV